nr:hypothetical protein [Candidatus Njordarchaeum guaymaensis]
MKKIELRKIRILRRAFFSWAATSFAKAFRSTNSETLEESDSQVYPKELAEPYVRYDEQTRARLQLLELERQKAEAISLVRRRTCM